MRSLWSGVSGLQAHQIAMDVEGNNIANVNTYGFKYNRANFADILSQTPRVATAPQGQLGGQNAMANRSRNDYKLNYKNFLTRHTNSH